MKVIEKIIDDRVQKIIKDCECAFNGKNPKAACQLNKPCGKPIIMKGGKK